MARRTLNRKELRAAAEAAEASEANEDSADEADDDDDSGDEEDEKPAKKKAAPKKRKSRAKADKIVRKKAFWGVFNQSMKRVAMFEYHERSAAEKKAEEMSAAQKTPHFIRPVKEEISE